MEIKDALQLDMDADEVQEKLEMLRKADLIGDLSSIDYIGPSYPVYIRNAGEQLFYVIQSFVFSLFFIGASFFTLKA